jgi:hypothetical protein
VEGGHAGSRCTAGGGKDIADGNVLDELGVEFHGCIDVTENMGEDFFGICVLEPALFSL